MKKTFILMLTALPLFFSCHEIKPKTIINNQEVQKEFQEDSHPKIKVLNVGTFHFGNTSDGTKTEFDEEGKKEQLEIRHLNKLLAEFKPTIICVEISLKNTEELNNAYQNYLKNPDKLETNYAEISLIAFEVGRLNNVKKLYGIDHQLEYNWKIGDEIINSIDSTTYKSYKQNPFAHCPEINQDLNELTLIEKFKLINNSKYQDFLLNINADILTYVGSENGFEGADEAAKIYKRNLRMFSNINRISIDSDDRIFILSGGLHAAFFKNFIERSPKYELVDIFRYLK